jgi:hypothetical protein
MEGAFFDGLEGKLSLYPTSNIGSILTFVKIRIRPIVMGSCLNLSVTHNMMACHRSWLHKKNTSVLRDFALAGLHAAGGGELLKKNQSPDE